MMNTFYFARIFFILLFFHSHFHFFSTLKAGTLKVVWASEFRKELHFNCPFEGEWLCQEICGDGLQCLFREGICRDCIGGGFLTSFLQNQIGKSIINQGEEYPIEKVSEILHQGNFSTLEARDVYNILDPFDSREVRERFRALCFPGDFFQIVFFELDPITRRRMRPVFVYCGGEEEGLFYQLTQFEVVEINENKYHLTLDPF